jgi:hypothetical protein
MIKLCLTAIVLGFLFVGCGPKQNHFPPIEKAGNVLQH